MTLLRYSWTQPCCASCFEQRNPGRMPAGPPESDPEVCCHCGMETRHGIYVRVDPETVPHPTAERD